MQSFFKLEHTFKNNVEIQFYTQNEPPFYLLREWKNRDLYLESIGFERFDNIYLSSDIFFVIRINF